MAEISAGMVKDLREKTGAGMMDCKKALSESGGDFAKAEEWLRKKGISKAASKGARVAAEGLIGSSVAGNLGVIAEVNCETDFVARNDDFIALAKDIAAHVAKNNPADVAALLEQDWGGKKVKDALTEKVAKIGENISVRRFARFQVEGHGAVGSYVHSNGRLGVLVEVGANSDASAKSEDVTGLARELAMQVAGANARWLGREQVPAEILEKEKDIFRAELAAAKKPEAMWDKIMGGKLEKFYETNCLVDQVWIKDDKKKIKQVIADVAKKVGGDVAPRRFSRIEVGERIERKKEDLASEVAKTLGQA